MDSVAPEPSPEPTADSIAGRTPYPLDLVRTTCLLVLTVLACGMVLSWLRPVVVPFLVALALFYLLSPVRRWLVIRAGVSETLGVIGATGIGLTIVVVTGALVWACVAEMIRDSAVYVERLAQLADDPKTRRVVEWAGFEHDPDTNRVVLITSDQARQIGRFAVSWLQGLLGDTVLVLLFLLFMLTGGAGARARSSGLPGEAAGRVRRYLIEMFLFSALTGVLVGGILGVLGVRFWMSFGFLAFVLNFIPTLGPVTATLLPIPVVVLDPNLSWMAKVLAIALPGAVQFVLGNVIQPRFQSRTQGVHPVATMLALIVFGMLWGPVGAVLAVPLTAVLKIAFGRIPGGTVFADLLGGRLGHNSETTESPASAPVGPAREPGLAQ